MPGDRSQRRKVLVLGHDTRAFLSVVRSLGRAGIEVHVAWFEDGAPALRSRYIARTHRLAPFRPDEDEWKDELVALMRAEAFDLVLPCDDQRALPLAAHRDELERWGRIGIPDANALDVLGDKHRTTALAASLGVPVPREAILSDPTDMAVLRHEFVPPVIVKPAVSYDLKDLGVRRIVRRADSWEAADLLLQAMLADGPVAIQELCRGVGVGVELLVSEGAPLLTFQHERLHEPLRGGGSSYRRGVPLSPELLEASLEVLGALRYTGVAMVEFKRDPASGRWVLLEVNPRFWGSLPLAIASGADFPLALFQLLVDGRTEVANGYRAGLRARNLRADAKWHLANLRADRSDPTLSSKPWAQVAGETLASVLTGRERSDAFTRDDPGPGISEAAQIVRDLARRTRVLPSMSRSPIARRRRLRLETGARAELARATSVLFVCKGNIGRSPFAAAIADRLLAGGRKVASAGLLAEGRASPPDAIAAASAWRVDLTEHRSRKVSADLVSRSDAIFVFDRENRDRMLERFPDVSDRLHLVGALDARGPLYVPDPWGRGPEAYAASYRRIAEALEAGVNR